MNWTRILAFLPRLWSLVRSLGVAVAALFPFLRGLFKGLASSLGSGATQKVAVWVLQFLAKGALFKAMNLTIIIMVFYWLIDLIDGVVFSDLGTQLLSSFNLLPSQIRCAMILIGLPKCLKLIISTSAAVTTMKIMIKLVTK